MKRAVTLKENYEFRRLYQKGASAVGGGMVLYCRKTGRGTTGLADGIRQAGSCGGPHPPAALRGGPLAHLDGSARGTI